MPTYILKGDYPMKRGGRHLRPGAAVEMTEREAEPYVKSGRLVAAPAPEPTPEPAPEPTPEPDGAAGEPAAAPPPDPKPVSGAGKGGKTKKNA